MYSDNMDTPYFRNGRKMQDLLPLWQGAEGRGGPGSACRRGQPVHGLPQRQENVGFAAVVARGGGPEGRSTARNGKPERPQRAEERSNMERRYFIGHSSRRASDGRIPETFHTETRAARIFIINTTAATTKVTASADRNPEVRTGHGARVSAAG